MHRVALDLVEDPAQVRLAVIEYNVSKVVTDIETGARTPTLRILRIEPVVDRDEVLRVSALLGRERNRRHHRGPLPGQLDLLDPDVEVD
jgi:hypothetical protein